MSAASGRVPLRKNRDFILLSSGQVVSTVGSEVSSLAFPLLVLALTALRATPASSASPAACPASSSTSRPASTSTAGTAST